MAFQRGRSKGFRAKSRQSTFADDNAQANDPPRLPSKEKLEQRARNVLLHQLSRSAKSAEQLRKILQQREIPEEIAEAAITRFIEVGLIDDVAYAETIVTSRRSFKGLAKSAIKRELNEKGISQVIADEALAGITPEDEFELAKQLAVKRFGQMAHLDREVRERRLAGYLQRKGYGSGSVYAAIKHAEAEYQAESHA